MKPFSRNSRIQCYLNHFLKQILKQKIIKIYFKKLQVAHATVKSNASAVQLPYARKSSSLLFFIYYLTDFSTTIFWSINGKVKVKALRFLLFWPLPDQNNRGFYRWFSRGIYGLWGVEKTWPGLTRAIYKNNVLKYFMGISRMLPQCGVTG